MANTTKKATKKVTTSKTSVSSKKTVKVTEDAIRQRAYSLYLENKNSDAYQNWIKAERELKGLK